MTQKRNIIARPQPNGKGHQVTYQHGKSRKMHHFQTMDPNTEQAPHGAGSYHDPAQHWQLMDSVDAYLKER